MTKKVIKIIQITDTHLSADPADFMLGMNTSDSLADVLDLVRQQQDQIDCILCTGDLSQGGSIDSYRYFEKSISSFSVPHLWLCGNHDSLGNMMEAVGVNNPCLNKLHTTAGWQIIMLNTSVKGEIHGNLAGDELFFLDEALSIAEEAGLNVLIGLHHNPMPVNAEWLQNVCLHNSDEFFAVIDKYKHVKGVIFGHIHQEMELERNGVLMLASPSTCIQFDPDEDEFTLDDMNPGYRWLELTPEGNINTGIQRVEGKRYTVDFASKGY